MSFTDVWFGFSVGVGLSFLVNEALRYRREHLENKKMLIIRDHLIDLRNHMQEEHCKDHAKH